MPTTRTVTVKSSAGDYTTLSAAEAGEQGDLVTLDRYLVVECYAKIDTTRCVWNGWTTDSTRKVTVTCPAGQGHEGYWDETKYIYRVTNDFGIMDIRIHDIEFIGLQLDSNITDGGGSNTRGTGFNITGMSSGWTVKIDRCIIRKTNTILTSTNDAIIAHAQPQGTLICTNNVAWGFCQGYRMTGAGVGSIFVCYNNVAYAPASAVGSLYPHSGVSANALTIYLKNCIAQNHTDSWGPAGNISASSVYDTNITDTTETIGTNTIISTTLTFVDKANGDFRLASTDTAAIDAGLNLSADSIYAFSTDITNTTRSGTWDIGAHEYVSAGPGTFYQSVGGTLNLSGGLSQKTKVNLDSSLTLSGVLALVIALQLTGLLSLAGNLSVKVKHFLTGSLSLAGTLVTNFKQFISLTSTLSSSGSVSSIYDEEGGGTSTRKRGHSIFGAISKRVRRGKRRRRR